MESSQVFLEMRVMSNTLKQSKSNFWLFDDFKCENKQNFTIHELMNIDA